MKKRGAIAKQGPMDGLCGFFCLVNAIRHWERLNGPDDTDSFRYLLEAADRLRLIKVSKLTGGFEAHELVDVFNEFARAHRYPAKAILLQAMIEALPNWSFTVQSKRIFEQDGQIVTSVDGGKHWVLAYEYDFKKQCILVEDPDPSAGCHKSIVGQQVGRDGVIILPTDSTLSFEN